VHGEPRLAAVARRLAISERALLLIEERMLSCSEIAFLLGYAEPAAFLRAFERWTGAPPQQYRDRGRIDR
jgi:AraC-like DNA-binding protein